MGGEGEVYWRTALEEEEGNGMEGRIGKHGKGRGY